MVTLPGAPVFLFFLEITFTHKQYFYSNLNYSFPIIKFYFERILDRKLAAQR